MTNLRNLNRAVQSAEFPSHDFAQAVREWIAAATERMEPASEGAQVGQGGLCPNCKRTVKHEREHTVYMKNAYICERYEPAQPEPAAPVGEMPEAVEHIIQRLRYEATTQLADSQAWRDNRKRLADNLDSWWRSHTAQPKVADLYEYIKRELDDLLGSCNAIVALEGVPLNWKFAAEIRDKAKTLAAKVEIADVSRRTGFSPPAAQPKVAMTEELETVMVAAQRHAVNMQICGSVPAGSTMVVPETSEQPKSLAEANRIQVALAAVRAQAAGVKP